MCSLKIRYNINFRYSNTLPTLAFKPRQKLTKDTWPQRSNSMMFIKYTLKTHFCFGKKKHFANIITNLHNFCHLLQNHHYMNKCSCQLCLYKTHLSDKYAHWLSIRQHLKTNMKYISKLKL